MFAASAFAWKARGWLVRFVEVSLGKHDSVEDAETPHMEPMKQRLQLG